MYIGGIEMDKLDMQEKIWGGIFGLVAILAAIAEMLANGISASSVFGMIKDVAGTLVVVVVMVAVARLLVTKKTSRSFEERLQTALEDWKNTNSNMIVKNDAMDGKSKDATAAPFYGLGIKTDMNDFYNDVSMSTRAGWFVRLPVIKKENYNHGNIEIKFHLNSETFFGRGRNLSDDELNIEFDKLSKMFSQFINRRFAGFADAAGKNDSIKVIIRNSIVNDEDIALLIDLINTTYTAYLVSSHINVK